MRALALSLISACTLACTQSPPTPTGPTPDTVSSKDSPVEYKVLEDKTDNNSVEYHVLIAEGTKHDDVESLLKYLYRYTMKRRGEEPAGIAAYVYTTEVAYKTPPRNPVAQVVKKSSDAGPTFDDKVPLEFFQEIDQALFPRRDVENEEQYLARRAEIEKQAMKPKVDRDDAARTVTITWPYSDRDKTGKEVWAETLSFNQSMNAFTDVARQLFEGARELKAMTFVGMWKDKEVVRIALSRADYSAAKLNEIDERIGEHHGRVFLELATNRSSDAKAAKQNSERIAKEYKAMLKQLKDKAKVDPGLK